MVATVQRNEPVVPPQLEKVQLITNSEGGKKKRNKKLLEHKVKGKKKNYKEGVSCWCLRRGCGRAGLRPGEGSGNGPKQHTIASLIFLFKSLTPPHHQALFFSDWGNAGPPEAAKQITEPLGAVMLDLPVRGCLPCLSTNVTVHPGGRREEENPDSNQLTNIWGKETTLTPVCSALC